MRIRCRAGESRDRADEHDVHADNGKNSSHIRLVWSSLYGDRHGWIYTNVGVFVERYETTAVQGVRDDDRRAGRWPALGSQDRHH